MKGSLIGGKYRLTRQLGEGAMGVVWEAVNERTSGKFALKLIRSPNPDLRLRLLREARACGSLKHRNVVEVYDVGETEQGDPFLVMQLLSGETLAELIARLRWLDPPLTARIGRDIAGALVAAQDAGVVHRDLKPANVFLHQERGTDGFVVKVVDFGVSKILSGEGGAFTVTGGVIGSPVYMSPEQAQAVKDVDHRTDIWSLGVILYEMLTGVRPFQGSGQELLKKIVEGEIPRVSQRVRRIDPELDEIVASCLERDRHKRISSASDLASRLDRFAALITPAPNAPQVASSTGPASTTTSPLVNPAASYVPSPPPQPEVPAEPIAVATPAEPGFSRRVLLAVPIAAALLTLGGGLIVIRLRGPAATVEPAPAAAASAPVEATPYAAAPVPPATDPPAAAASIATEIPSVSPPVPVPVPAAPAAPASARAATPVIPAPRAEPPVAGAPRAAPPIVTAPPVPPPSGKGVFLKKKKSLVDVP